MGDPSLEFARFCGSLMDRFRTSGNTLHSLSAYEQETVALYLLNSDYGANGLIAYFDWHGRTLLEPTLRGLARIGADRLAVLVKEYADLLAQQGFLFGEQNVYAFLESLSAAAQEPFDLRQAEAADLYADFYDLCEKCFTSGVWRH